MINYAAGGCLCGSIRYTCAEEPLMSGICHCTDCQENSGSAFIPILIFKKESVSVVGNTSKVFEHNGDSGKSVRRSFCSNCGSPYMVEYEVTPDFRVILAGTLDDKSKIKPEWNIYTDSKQPWVELPLHIKSFERGFKRN